MPTVQILNIILAIIVFVIFTLALIAVAIIYKIRQDKVKKEKQLDINADKTQTDNGKQLITRTGKSIDSIYKFMEFDEIVDNMIIRKNGQQYVMVIGCKGINYDLLSEVEKESVEAGFIELLNTLRFPIQLYVQTRTLNLEDLLKEYDKRIEETRSQIRKLDAQIELARDRGNIDEVNKLVFERKRKYNILEYGESIEDYTAKVSESKNILQQKTFIVISYYKSEYGDTSKLSKDEIYDIAFSELYTRAQSIISALTSSEISGKVLSSEQLAELLYIAYNRDEAEKYSLRDALNAEYDRLYSTAVDVMNEKKRRIEQQVENNAVNLASKMIIKADRITRERRAEMVKKRASEMVDEVKSELSIPLYQETKQQLENATIEEALQENEETQKKRVIRRKA